MKHFTILLSSLLISFSTSFANDDCSNATVITPTTNINTTISSFAGSTITTPSPSCANNATQDVWFQFTAIDSSVKITLPAVTNLDHGFEIYESSCNSSPTICINSNGAGNAESFYGNGFEPGKTYYIRVFHLNGVSTLNFSISVQTFPAPVNNSCANAIPLNITSVCSSTTGSFLGATLSNVATPACSNTPSQDIWYKFNANVTSVNVNLNPVPQVNHGFQVFEGNCQGTEIKCENSNGAAVKELAIVNGLTIGETYYVRIFNDSSLISTSNIIFCIYESPAPCPPTINITASQTTICSEDTINLTATHVNAGVNFSCQWLLNGNNLNYNSSFIKLSHLNNGDEIECLITSSNICALDLPPTRSNKITIAVNPATPAVFTQIGTLCYDTLFSLPTISDNLFNGSWTPAFNNRDTTTYTFRPLNGQCAGATTMTVPIQPLTKPLFTAIDNVCYNILAHLPNSSLNMISGSWLQNSTSTPYKRFIFTPTAGQCADTTHMYVRDLNMVLSIDQTYDHLFIYGVPIASSVTWVDCNTNLPIPGANTYKLTFTNNGSYKAIATYLDCTQETHCVDITHLSTSELDKHISLNIFPNPTFEGIVLNNTNDLINTLFSINDITGKVILSGKIEKSNQDINLYNIPAGMYFIHLSEINKSIKFIKM